MLLGIAENEGRNEGWLLGHEEGRDVGRFETEGCVEDCMLGEVLVDGDADGTKDG